MNTFEMIALLMIAALAAGCDDEESKSNDAGGTGAATAGTGGTNAGGEGAAGAAATGLAVGEPCSVASECQPGGSGEAACFADWPGGGYCAVTGCETHGHDCPNDPGLGGTATTGGKCVLAPAETCLALCESDADCREGYVCVEKPDAAGHGTANVCFPANLGGTGSGGGMGTGGGMGSSSGGMMGSGGGGMGM